MGAWGLTGILIILVALRITDLIFQLVDREPESEALSKEDGRGKTVRNLLDRVESVSNLSKDVYLAMFALVGVRGSISSKTVNKNVP